MYKLYTNSRGKKLLDVSDNEEDIIFTLETYIGFLDTINYEIKKVINNREDTISIIRSYEDYINYKYKNNEPNKTLLKRRCK